MNQPAKMSGPPAFGLGHVDRSVLYIDIWLLSLNAFSCLCVCVFFQVFQLNVQQASGNVVPPNNSGSVTQVVQVANPQRVSHHQWYSQSWVT